MNSTAKARSSGSILRLHAVGTTLLGLGRLHARAAALATRIDRLVMWAYWFHA